MNRKLLFILLITSFSSFSGALRYDITAEDYESFAMNNGKFKLGNTNVNVYKKDGSKSGTLEVVPNFDGVNTEGSYSFLDDPQILSGVKHIGNLRFGYEFLSRHIRKDVNLYNGNKKVVSRFRDKDTLNYEEYNLKINELKKFSETAIGNQYTSIGTDWALVRLDRVLHDATTNEVLYDLSRVSENDLVARMGRGERTVSFEDGTSSKLNRTYSGGLNRITKFYNGLDEKRVNIRLDKTPKTAMDIGTNNGDSGSPLFWWDKENKKWLFLANNSAGNGALENRGWDVVSILRSDIDKYRDLKLKTQSNEIDDAYSAEFKSNKLLINGKEVFNANITKRNEESDFYNLKNQIFNVPNLVIQVLSNTNINEARLEFKENTRIDGIADLKTAGYVIDEDKTLTYKLKINKGNIVRKIGKGTLYVNSLGNNEGDINIGEGTLLLNNTGGYAAKNIRVAKGAIVKLMSENQLNANNIYFGLRGGKLDLNGNSLKFEDIYHIDRDAEIKNTSEKFSNFELNFKGDENRTYLGSFIGNINLKYKPSNNIAWELRGKSDIKGKFDIEDGKVIFTGDNIIVGAYNDILLNEFERSSFKSKEINVKGGSILEFKRAIEVDSNINLSPDSKIELILEGEVKDKGENLDFENSKTEEEINKTILKGNINFSETSTIENFKLNIENNNKVVINSKIAGNVKATKTGKGLLEISSIDNINTGTFVINEGKVKVAEKTSLGNTITKISEDSILEVDKNIDFPNLLDRIDKSSTGILSLGENVTNLDVKYKNYPNLYLGSSKEITIGNENIKIPEEINIINLGGDGGIINLKGKGLLRKDKTINIYKGSKVNIIEDNNQEIDEPKVINLNYGAFGEYKDKKYIKEGSLGVLELENEKNIENTMYVGAKKNTSLSLDNIEVKDEYKLSGRGTLILNNNLISKNIIVDAQYSDSGVIDINSINPTYIGNITIIGNREDKNQGSITLKIDNKEELGNNNSFLIKDGGILDVSATELNLRLHKDNEDSGKIINSGNNESKLNLLVEENILVNNLITGDIKVVKSGNGDIEFTNSENTIKDLEINSGKLIVREDELENTNIILKENTEAEILADVSLKSVNNSGIIKSEDNIINIGNYLGSSSSLIDLVLNNKENLLNIENVDVVNVKVTLGNDINKDKDVLIGTLPGKINLVNADNLSNLFKYKVTKKEMQAILTKIISEKAVSRLYFLNELNLLATNSDVSIFKNGVYASFINYNKKDNEVNSQENKKYQNSLLSNGVKLDIEVVNKIKDLEILSGVDFKTMYSNVSTKLEENEVNSNFLITEILPKFGIKYGMFSGETKIGYINVLDTTEKGNIHMIKHSLDVSISPVFKLTKDIELQYLNNLGYVINPIIKDNMKVKVENSSPFYARYNTGIKLKHKYVDAYVEADLGVNLSKINLKENEVSLDNTYTDVLRTKFKIGLDGKPTKNILISTNFGLNLNRKSYSDYSFKLGLGYSW
ncbi:S6 family peptidase [Streptobacillus canis]|uniref:S6 family peptidase n=1 Tax=Streptobacillus canis TaxID=2678686 RepID=UPI0018CBF85A|nr:S6 family peptidase [Streptobacillus canis]